MATLGTGIVPSGEIGTELTAVTRRAFVPKLIEQLYKARPLLNMMLDYAQMGTGGVSSVTIPVQGTEYTTFEWSSYGGNFSAPTNQTGAFNAEFNYKLGIVPIPFLGMEGLLQLDHSVIPLIEARMNDAMNVTRAALSTELYTNTTDTSKIIGLPAAIDDGTNVVTYGGLSRTTNTWWKAIYKDRGGSVDPIRSLLLEDIANVTQSTGEMPSCGFCGFGTWVKLAQDFIGLERYSRGPNQGFDSSKAAFQAIEVAGVPIYADPDCTEGRYYFLNENYVNLHIHEAAAFNFTGFESLLPNNMLGYLGALVIVLELTNAKCKANGQVRGYTSVTF